MQWYEYVQGNTIFTYTDENTKVFVNNKPVTQKNMKSDMSIYKDMILDFAKNEIYLRTLG